MCLSSFSRMGGLFAAGKGSYTNTVLLASVPPEWESVQGGQGEIVSQCGCTAVRQNGLFLVTEGHAQFRSVSTRRAFYVVRYVSTEPDRGQNVQRAQQSPVTYYASQS